MFTFFTDRQKRKAYISQSSALGGEKTEQDKNKEKKSVQEVRWEERRDQEKSMSRDSNSGRPKHNGATCRQTCPQGYWRRPKLHIKIFHALKKCLMLECNPTPLLHLVYADQLIC